MKTLEYYKEQTKTCKFEFEKPITPYLYECTLDGDGSILASMDDDGHFAASIALTCEEWETFNEGDNEFPYNLVFVEDSQGFCYTMTEDHYGDWKG